MARAMKADRVLAGADLNTRRAYELRASRSEPGLEPVPETPQLAPSAGEPQPVPAALETADAASEGD
jgi:hypothetical protein